MEIVYFVVGFGVMLSVGLDREWLGFVRRCGSNVFGISEWILWRVSCVELLCISSRTL